MQRHGIFLIGILFGLLACSCSTTKGTADLPHNYPAPPTFRFDNEEAVTLTGIFELDDFPDSGLGMGLLGHNVARLSKSGGAESTLIGLGVGVATSLWESRHERKHEERVWATFPRKAYEETISVAKANNASARAYVNACDDLVGKLQATESATDQRGYRKHLRSCVASVKRKRAWIRDFVGLRKKVGEAAPNIDQAIWRSVIADLEGSLVSLDVVIARLRAL